jgi:hypothetical protein
MKPDEYVKRRVELIVSATKLIDPHQPVVARFDKHIDQRGFKVEITVPLRGGGSILVVENVRFQKRKNCQPVEGNGYITDYGYTLRRSDDSTVRFDFDPTMHPEIGSHPHHKHNGDEPPENLQTGDPRRLSEFLRWAIQARRVSRPRRPSSN